MLRFPFIFMALVTFAGPLGDSRNTADAIKLLPGYRIKNEPAIDVVAWTIEKPGGLIIHFEAGPSEGAAVSENGSGRYEWYRQQTVNGHRALFALVKPGRKTSSGVDSQQSFPPRDLLLVTFPLGGFGGAAHDANFTAEIRNHTDLADALLMILTFDPEKGPF